MRDRAWFPVVAIVVMATLVASLLVLRDRHRGGRHSGSAIAKMDRMKPIIFVAMIDDSFVELDRLNNSIELGGQCAAFGSAR